MGRLAAIRPRVIVSADDMGMCAEWDDAILRCHRSGVVSAVSVVTNGPTYPAAVRALRSAGDLDVGVHLNVLVGCPLGDPRKVPTLVTPSGRLHGTVGRFIGRYLAGKVAIDEVEAEWVCQVEAALANDPMPSHLNSHFHLHMLPGLFDTTLRIARKYGIRWVRVTNEPPWEAVMESGLSGRQVAKVALLWSLSRTAHRRLRRAGQEAGVGCRGLAMDGSGGQGWTAAIRRLPVGVTELVCHPGQFGPQTAALESPALAAELRTRALPTTFRNLGDRT